MAMIYMNNAATSWPKAPGAAETVEITIKKLPFHADRSGFNTPDSTIDCRQLLAAVLQITDPSRLVYCSNATHALNIALQGFPWKSGATVVTTAAEHNAVLRTLYYLRKHRQVQVKIVPVDGRGMVIPELWEEAIKKFSPQLVVFTHASNVTGCINPVAELSHMAQQVEAATLLDASQTMGLLEVTPERWGIDMVAFTGHKYLLGPPGTGGLYISDKVKLEPVLLGGTGILSQLEEMPDQMPGRFEAGTPNDPAFAGLATAVRWQQEHRPDLKKIEQNMNQLSLGLMDIGAKVVRVGSPRTPVVSFVLPGWDVTEVGEILYRSFDVICRTGLHCAPLIHPFLTSGCQGSIRLSLSRFTTEAEIDYLLSAVKAIAHELF